ncbi:hypothetical protein MMMDOFMJ_2543 [Methylobacterium gnaphalii]|uniref:Uncharacterized protein n=1 Tax=Methylobacterium gnaphalii TaxID=1010610 RepID=A0A512JQI8_9HYPH|nr:hypothetical protein MGN01_40650 [Methylobacterium gnaphalii]GJD69606.1 hypothetical protein MMMDOFMJ_2543 [Methylobacterium gnaphalii]GLS51530.1 hypothetical protein GCM10007885_43880 [Methylobacterium gnaphalii]
MNSRNEQAIAHAGAGNVEEMGLGLVDLLQLCLVAHRVDAPLRGKHTVVAREHHYDLEFQALGEMHRADGHALAGCA